MRVLTRQAVLLFLLIACAPLTDLKSQTPTDKKIATASVSGNVTIKGKPAVGITVVLRLVNSEDPSTRNNQAKTDQDGNYRISNLSPGSYEVSPDAPAFAVSADSRNGLLIISEGEAVDGIDFKLTKGGVITGRITNSEGQPIVEQPVNLMAVEYSQNFGVQQRGGRQNGQTDDRGVYRIFGLPPGKYRVAISGGGRRGVTRPTFYPGVVESAKATIVEVSEGSETKNIDIKVETNDSSEKFSVTGRIVDGVSGQPVPNVRIGVSRMSSTYSGSDLGSSSDKEGQFKIERLAVGHYGVYVVPPGDDLSADMVPFEIVDRDVDGVLIKTYRGGSVSGQILFEGDDKSIRSRLNQIMLEVYVVTPSSSSGKTVRLAPDMTFRLGGLKEGSLTFRAFSNSSGPTTGLTIARIERNGVVETRSIEIKDGEQVEGLKIFVGVGTGTIRGVVKMNGGLPPTAQISVWFSQAGDATRVQPQSVFVDSRGHFVAEGLAAGTYEVNVSVYVPGTNKRAPSAKQQVTVSDGNVTEITIPLDLSPGP